MIKRNEERHILPPLQRDIVLYLATEGSQTKNAIATGVSRSYKPTWTAFNSLTEKKLIKETDMKTWRGRDYPQFWLTDNGVLIALAEGANPDRLLEMTKQIYPKNPRLACYLEVLSKMSLHIIKTAYSALEAKGKLEPTDVINILLTETAKSSDQLQKEVIDTLKAYPKEYDLFKKRMDQIWERLDKLKNVIRE